MNSVIEDKNSNPFGQTTQTIQEENVEYVLNFCNFISSLGSLHETVSYARI